MIDEKKLIRMMWDKFNSFYNVALRFDESETKMANKVLSDVNQIIDSMPKTGEWIPVTQRTPEDFEWVLVWFKDHLTGTEGCDFAYQVEDVWYGSCISNSRKVLAWMPKPPNYEGDHNG